MLRRLLVAPLVIVVLAMATGGSGASEAHPRIIVLQVDSVLGENTSEPSDHRPDPWEQRYRGLFSYRTYRRILHQEKSTECGKMAAFNLPGGRILQVSPNAVDGDMIEMAISLFDGARPMLTSDLKLRNRGNLIVGGPHYQQGMLIISIGVRIKSIHGSPDSN
jgi:hypothetical protein